MPELPEWRMPTEAAERELLAAARGRSEDRSFLIDGRTGEIAIRTERPDHYRTERYRYHLRFRGNQPWLSYDQLRADIHVQMDRQRSTPTHTHTITRPDTPMDTPTDGTLSYFIHEDYLDDFDIPDDIGVEFAIGDDDGILVTRQQLDQIAMDNRQTIDTHRTDLEGIYSVDFTEIIGDVPGTHEPEPGHGPEPEFSASPQVVFNRHDIRVACDPTEESYTPKFMKLTEEILLPVVNKTIHFMVPHSQSQIPVEDGKTFNIWIWSGYNGSTGHRTPDYMFGIKVDCQDEGYKPGDGYVIRDDTGYAVAELKGSNLYVFHDIVHKKGTSRELEIFRRILEETVKYLVKSPEELAEIQRRQEEEIAKRTKEKYLEVMTSSRKTQIKETQDHIKELVERADTYRREIMNLVRLSGEYTARLAVLEAAPGIDTDKALREFDTLLNHPKVTGVRYVDEVFEVSTVVLNCRHPRTGNLHEIGAFKIMVDFNKGRIRWFNQTRRIDGVSPEMQAPHIFNDGHPCLGNMETVLADLLAAYELYAIIMMAISFVEEVNLSDAAGKYLGKWPVVEIADGSKPVADEPAKPTGTR